MANSKDIKLKKFKIVFGWILALAIVALSFWAYNIIEGSRGYACSSPNSAAQADLRNLLTSLEAYHIDHNRYPLIDEVPSFYEVSDDVTASFLTSNDKQSFILIALHKEGNRIFFTSNETHYIYYIDSREKGLVKAEPL